MDWNALYSDPKMCLREPAEEVVKLLPLLESKQAKRLLDLGFGAGRHVVYFASRGYDVYGSDVSLKGLQITREWLAAEGLEATLNISDMTRQEYPDSFFDACICRGVITHNSKENIQSCIREIFRTLRPGGLAMITFISNESSLFGCGEEIEPNTFVLNDGIEEGVPHHFVDEEEVKTLMSAFCLLEVRHSKHQGLVDVGTPYVSAHWIVVAEKPVSDS